MEGMFAMADWAGALIVPDTLRGTETGESKTQSDASSYHSSADALEDFRTTYCCSGSHSCTRASKSSRWICMIGQAVRIKLGIFTEHTHPEPVLQESVWARAAEGHTARAQTSAKSDEEKRDMESRAGVGSLADDARRRREQAY